MGNRQKTAAASPKKNILVWPKRTAATDADTTRRKSDGATAIQRTPTLITRCAKSERAASGRLASKVEPIPTRTMVFCHTTERVSKSRRCAVLELEKGEKRKEI